MTNYGSTLQHQNTNYDTRSDNSDNETLWAKDPCALAHN